MNHISLEQKDFFHKNIISSSRKQGSLMFIATLIALFALVAIISALVCIICFSGLNVIHQIIFPIILPSSLALVFVSLPLIIYVLRSYKETKSQIRNVVQVSLDALKSFYNQQILKKPDKNAIAAFLEENIINISANKFYCQEFLQVLKDLFPNKKNRTQEDMNLIMGIDRAIENLKLSDKQKKKRDEQELKKSKQ